MSTTGASGDARVDDVAAAVRDAGFVRFVARADGDGLAAAGLLAGACRDAGIPFQASVAATTGAAADRLEGTDGLGVTLGIAVPGADHAVGDAAGQRPVSAAAAAVVRALGADPDPVLALAGVVAAGHDPGTVPDLLKRAEATAGVERRSGIAVPTDEPADGLAHSTLLHGPFSADPAAAADLVAAADDGRDLASLVAVETTGQGDAADTAASALERALGPYATPDAPVATVGGFADVLDALARAAPGTGVALALADGVADEALDRWRDHASRAHGALRAATTGRYDGLLVARLDDRSAADRGGVAQPVVTVARLLAAFRSPEPVGLAVAAGEAAVAGPDPPVETLRDAAASLDGDAGPVARGAYARFDGTADDLVTAFREAV